MKSKNQLTQKSATSSSISTESSTSDSSTDSASGFLTVQSQKYRTYIEIAITILIFFINDFMVVLTE